jgi:peptidoglycan hydrolase-like protein with peptidoglycan-binding domain
VSISAAAHHGRSRRRRPSGGLIALGILTLAVIAVLALLAFAANSTASVRAGSEALATVRLPFGGGSITSVVVSRAQDNRLVPARLSDGRVTPTAPVTPGERLIVYVTIRRPGFISWLTGSTEHVVTTLRAPSATLTQSYVTLRRGEPLRIRFSSPIRLLEMATGQGRSMRRLPVGAPVSSALIPHQGPAGSVEVAVAARPWERPEMSFVSWFPAGTAATAVARPSPGTTIGARTPITLTFSKPVSRALGSSLPPVSPGTAGRWETVNAHTIRFVPKGYGYGLGATVTVALPAGIHLIGGQQSGSDPRATWTVPVGSTLRLQELLANLGYLPLNFTPSGGSIPLTMAAQESAAMNPPQGSWSWRYPNTPSDLVSEWQPGSWSVLTKGAVMAFENTEGLTVDGIPGPEVWRTLIQATIAHQVNTFGYTYVNVSESQPETEQTWHNGSVVVSGLVNTGIPAAPTAQGVFAVYEHLRVTTMTGRNPNGTRYDDKGIPYVSYFNGGDALHGFIRASYGFPQSLGCVEMPFSEAGQVWPYTPLGTIVNVH